MSAITYTKRPNGRTRSRPAWATCHLFATLRGLDRLADRVVAEGAEEELLLHLDDLASYAQVDAAG